ncbi:hypothetical protein BH11ACT6_BH11ACT6_34840 [soil metagenome]
MALSQAEQQAARNAGIVTLAARELATLWPRLDWASEAALTTVTAIYRALTISYGQATAAVAAEAYDARRREQRIRGRFVAAPAPPVPDEQISNVVESAFRGKVTVTLLDPEPVTTTSELPVDQRVPQRLAQSLSRLVLQPGRDTIAANARRDPAKARYIRVPIGETTCEFCIMLASRAIDPKKFRGYNASNVRLDEVSQRLHVFAEDGEKYHKGCDCEAVPYFPGDDIVELSPKIRDYQDVYYKATAAAGTSSDTTAILAEMRQLLKPTTAPDPDPPRRRTRRRSESREDTARRHLPILEENLRKLRDQGLTEDAPQVQYHVQQIERMRKRLGEQATPPVELDDPLSEVRRKADDTPNLAADLAVTNPNFAAGQQWQINCTRCAATVELRARGYDVTAEPRPRSVKDNGYRSVLERWTSPDGSPAGRGAGTHATRAVAEDEQLGMSAGSRVWHWLPTGGQAAREAADTAARQWGDGARGFITVVWKGNRAAHIFNVENRSGTVVYTDGQNNRIDASDYWARISGSEHAARIVRTDDLTPTRRVMEWARERTDADDAAASLSARQAAILSGAMARTRR